MRLIDRKWIHSKSWVSLFGRKGNSQSRKFRVDATKIESKEIH